jgi:glycosyltransferase involved in cell wall biosynthesis
VAPPPFKQHRLFTPPHHRLENWLLPLELAALRVDLLHSPDMVVPRAWHGRSVVTVHDLAFLEQPSLVTDEAARYYGGVTRSVHTATRIITVSEHSARQIVQHTGADATKLRVVPNAVHPRYFEPADPLREQAILSRLGLVSGRYVLHVGTIEPRKNLTLLLDAFAGCTPLGLSLVLAGEDGWLSDSVRERAARDDVADAVRFLGRVSNADLPAVYRGALIVAHPALDEGFGMTLAEAMACGTPVLASSAGAIPEVVGAAGELLPPESPQAWSLALTALALSEPRRAELVVLGRQRAQAFTIESTAAKTYAVYVEALT